MDKSHFIIKGSKCGRDKNGTFHCQCGECTEKLNENSSLVIKSQGIRAHVIKDGVDITKGIKAIHIDFKAGNLPVITVERVEPEVELSICDCMYREKPADSKETADG